MSSSKIRNFLWDFAVRFRGGLFMFMFIFMSVSVTQNTCKGGPFLVGLSGIHHICHMV